MSHHPVGITEQPVPAVLTYGPRCGLILLNKHSRIAAVNSTAKQMLERQTIIKQDNGRLMAGGTAQARLADSLRRILSGAEECCCFVVTDPPVQQPVCFSITRHESPHFAVLVAVSDIRDTVSVDERLIATTFGATPTEAAVASHLIRGFNVSDTAASLGIQVSTVRTHLKRLFEKTGARRQAELLIMLVFSQCSMCELVVGL